MLGFGFGFVFHIWGETCDLCLSEPGLLHLAWYSQIHPFIGEWQNFILLYGWIILHYVYIIYTHTHVCIYHIFLIHSSVVGYVGCFHSLAIMNHVAVNISVQMSLSNPVLHSFWYMSRSGIAGSYSGCIFSFLSSYCTAL
jgi:hypothetical protein